MSEQYPKSQATLQVRRRHIEPHAIRGMTIPGITARYVTGMLAHMETSLHAATRHVPYKDTLRHFLFRKTECPLLLTFLSFENAIA